MLPTGETATGCVNINECNESPCDTNAQCADSVDSYTCTCCNGYTGDGHSCVDINECDAALSNEGRKRRDIDGNYSEMTINTCYIDVYIVAANDKISVIPTSTLFRIKH